jgi:hypothetical protein
MDNPFDAKETRFWSIRTIPKFIFRGIPRLIIILIMYIIVFIVTLFFNDKNQALINKTLKWTTRTKLYFFGYNNIDISPTDIEYIKKSNSQIILSKHSSYLDILLMSYLFLMQNLLHLNIFPGFQLFANLVNQNVYI